MQRGTRQFLLYASGLIAIIAFAGVAYLSGHKELARLIGNLGAALYIVVVLIFIMLFDPARKFPSDRPMARLGKILTFQRK